MAPRFLGLIALLIKKSAVLKNGQFCFPPLYIILYIFYKDNTWYNLQISKAERGHAVVQKELVNSKKEETRRGAHLSDDVVTLFQTLEP